MATPPTLPPASGPDQQQVSLRGKSAKEISRDALLQKVSHERERRNYIRRASAAALFIQRVWRRYHLMKHMATKLQEEWKESMNPHIFHKPADWVSKDVLRPFLFFTAQLTMKRKLQLDGAEHLITCFEILLRSINSSESVYNFCSMAIGTSAERSTWLYQAKKLVILCSFLLAECDPKGHVGEGMVHVASLGMRILVSLTDPKGWKNFAIHNVGSLSTVLGRLLRHMVSRRSCFYTSIRKYISKLSIHDASHKSSAASDEHFLITASAITLALRPFHAKKLGIDDFGDFEVEAAEEYFLCILTIPYLSQRLPPILLPALGHESPLLPCFKVILNSKGKLFPEMLLADQSSESGELSNIMEGIPSVGWALANIIKLSTGKNSDSGDSECFMQGIDLQLYADTLCCLSDNFLCWLEKFKLPKTGKEGSYANGSILGAVHSDVGDKIADFGPPNMSYINQLKAIHQQWHLRVLLAAIEERGSFQAATFSSSNGSRNLKLTDVFFFYSYMLRIFHFLNPIVGSLPILNMLSFTPGFLPLLWKELDEKMFHSKRCKSSVSRPSSDYHSTCQNRTLEKKQKWAHVLQRITGKSDPRSSDLSNEISIPNKNEDDASDLWEIEPLILDSQGISKKLSVLLHLFCSAYAHLLLVLDDIEFYEKQVPFTLEQQIRISSVLNNLVYFSFIHSEKNNKLHVDAAIRCLLLLYERDCRRKFCPASLWVRPARKGRLPIAAAARAHEVAQTNYYSGDIIAQKSSIITTMPHVFPFDERVQMFREFIKLDKVSRRVAGELDGPVTEIIIRRNHIVEDGYRQLNSLGSRLKSSFNVSFISESGLPEVGLDYGGLSKEFLTDLSKLAFSPEYGLFTQTNTTERLLVPNISARFIDNGIEMIEFLGRIVGKALYEGILLDYSFCHTFVQKLLGRYSFLDELSTLDPELYRNLMYVKHYDGDVRGLSLDFTVTEDICGKHVCTELKTGGKDVLVTNDNKLQYVYAISDYKLNRRILPLANAFFRGLTDLISSSWLRLFNANEFNQLLSGGKHDFDVDDLKRNARYTGGYSEGSRTVKLFWEVVREFESNERCMLLKFVTSCSRAPLLGFKYLQPSFTIHKVACDTTFWSMIGGQDVNRLPSASTCYNTLKLPTYKRSSTLKSKLLYAISSNAGFELS